MNATSADGTSIYYEVTGSGDTALVFVHGWMGNVRWWDAQRDAFASTHRVVALDLAGHGQSGERTAYSAQAYADDIIAVIRAVDAPHVILVGHSMAGAYATIAASQIAVDKLILVDTLKNLDAIPPWEHLAPVLASYRADYATTVSTTLPKFLFAPTTPPAVRERLTREFLRLDGDAATARLEPLYRCDVRDAATRVRVPVRGIGTDLNPNSIEANRGYFADYDYVDIAGFGHYPMLEAPAEFDAALRAAITPRAER